MKRNFWIVLLLMCYRSTYGQLDSLCFKNYRMQDGLSANVCRAIVQDEEGYIWVGTTNGLNRFDGKYFRPFYQAQASLGLPGNYINKLLQFKEHRLGIVTRKGILELNTSNYTARPFLISDSTSFSIFRNGSFDLVQFGHETVYAFTSRTGFYVYRKDGTPYFKYEHFSKADISKRIDFAQDIFKLNEEELLVYCDNQLGYYNLKSNTFTFPDRSDKRFGPFFPDKENWTVRSQLSLTDYLFIPFVKDSIYYYNVLTGRKTASPLPFSTAKELYWASYIFPLNDSTYAINCTFGGVYLFNLDKNNGIVSFKPQKQLTQYRCNWFFCDREGRLWIATDNGLLKQELQKKKISAWPVYHENKNHANAYFSNTLVRGGNIYLSRYARSEGLYVFDAGNKQLKKKITFYGPNEEWNSVVSIQMYYEDTLWISSVPGILWLDTKTFNYGKVKLPAELNRRMLEMAESTTGSVAWMCGYLNNRAVRYDIKKRIFTVFKKDSKPAFEFTRPKHVLYDAEGNTWFTGHGLVRYDKIKNRFDSLINQYQGLNKHEDNILNASADKQGNIWFHSTENGLQCYNHAQKKFSSFTMKDGLPSNVIESMSPVIGDAIWLGFAEKLIRFNTVDKSILEFNTEDGLPGQNYTDERMYYDQASGKLYTALNNYLVAWDTAANIRKTNVISLYVDEIVVNGELVLYRPGDSIHLNYDQNKLRIALNTIDFNGEAGYTISYSIDNEDAIKVNGDEIVLNLESRYHHLTIYATGKYGTVLRKELWIGIEPPYWKKWWFIFASVLVLACFIYIWVHRRLVKIRKQATLNQRLSEFELKALHAQMNPHFIFNCLNSIKALILYNRNAEATQYLNKFSSLVRQNLDHSRKQFLSLQQNIEYLQQYINIESLRFTDFKLELIIDPKLDTNEIKIAPMLLQPLIENAIWHGLQNISGEKILVLRFREEGTRVICEIEDNGPGIRKTAGDKKTTHISIGIENIRQRIALLNEKYKLNYRLEIKDRSDIATINKEGTLVVLSFNTF